MSSHIIILVFDFIALLLGLSTCAAAAQMKKTGTPPQMLLSKEEQSSLKQMPRFCEKMYRPTVSFGCICAAYGLFGLFNRCLLEIAYADIFVTVCFLAGCYWYVRRLLRVKGECLIR